MPGVIERHVVIRPVVDHQLHDRRRRAIVAGVGHGMADVEHDAGGLYRSLGESLSMISPRFVDLAGEREAGRVIAGASGRRRRRGLTLQHADLDGVAVGPRTPPPLFRRPRPPAAAARFGAGDCTPMRRVVAALRCAPNNSATQIGDEPPAEEIVSARHAPLLTTGALVGDSASHHNQRSSHSRRTHDTSDRRHLASRRDQGGIGVGLALTMNSRLDLSLRRRSKRH